MVYDQFLETVRELLQTKLGSEHSLKIHPVAKNNGIMLDGLSDHSSACPLAPTVYLNPYYDRYEQGEMTLSEICTDLAHALLDNPPPDSIRTDDFADYVRMRPRIMMKLIHAKANRTLLQDIPYVPYLDLAIVFYLFLERNEKGQMTALIHNEQLEQWEISRLELLQRAIENTPDYYPAQIEDMDTVIRNIAREHLCPHDEELFSNQNRDEAQNIPLYVLTNSSGIYGAVCILYRRVLKNFADTLGKDLIIIPSSVHEVLLTPLEEGFNLSALNSMVVAVNQREVPAEDRLSNHVYLYRRAGDKITLPQDTDTARHHTDSPSF